jgi:hypothetical protein
VEPDSDVDFLVVTEAGRLWTSRAGVVAVVRAAARRGHRLCPNYFLSESALALEDRSLFTARELAQMVPLSGFGTYAHVRRANAWAEDLLPNAAGAPAPVGGPRISPNGHRAGPLRLLGLAEAGLSTRAGGPFERWEMRRKVRRFSARPAAEGEVAFSEDVCKGHFDGHGRRVVEAYRERLARLEEEFGW